MYVNQTLAQWSDLAFQAAMAGYLVALVCYLVEFASRRARTPVAEVAVAAAGHGSTAVLTRPADAGIGHVERAPRASFGDRLGRSAFVVTVVGLVANVLAIVGRGVAAHRPPLGNMYEFTIVFCAAAVLCWLIVLAKFRCRSAGIFVLLPIVLMAFVAGTVLYVPAAPLVPALNSYWKWVHVTTVSLSSAILMVSGAASVAYVVRSRYDNRVAAAAQAGEPAPASFGGRLPSLLVLDRIAYRTGIVGFPLFTFAVIAGALWAEVAWGSYWSWDPKETCALVTWVLYAGYLHARATAGWRGTRAAWISVLGFASILFNLFFVNIAVSGLHSYAGLN